MGVYHQRMEELRKHLRELEEKVATLVVEQLVEEEMEVEEEPQPKTTKNKGGRPKGKN